MRLDKYLKVSRIIKRRSIANEACSLGRVSLNGKVSKPSSEVKVGDTLTVHLGGKSLTAQILSIKETVRKDEAGEMYRIIADEIND